MRIDNWPLDRIMRLPDWCFGRRYWTGLYTGGAVGAINYAIAEEELPDKFVVWGLMIACRTPVAIMAIRLTIRLGDVQPTDIAHAQTFERLFKGISSQGIAYEFYPNPNGIVWVPAERQLVESKGRRLALVSFGDEANTYEMTVGVLISALPKEVPDWLSSGQEPLPY